MANQKEASCKRNKRGNKTHLPRGPWVMDGLDKARQAEASVSLVLESPVGVTRCQLHPEEAHQAEGFLPAGTSAQLHHL